MRFIRTLSMALLCVIIMLDNYSFANNSSVRPVSSLPQNFFNAVKNVDADFGLRETNRNTGAKICSCQILTMESANYQHHNVAVFAEKTNHGNYSSDYRIAKDVIEKEKKHLKRLFYDKLKVVNRIAQITDCKSLY
ncbi:MAG TPA: hypothetical protein VFV08_10065, partial [Puia sp.]|nr:hypothetical protein [Puia sp.]